MGSKLLCFCKKGNENCWNSQDINLLFIISIKLMGSRTSFSKLMGSMEPIKPMLTEPPLYNLFWVPLLRRKDRIFWKNLPQRYKKVEKGCFYSGFPHSYLKETTLFLPKTFFLLHALSLKNFDEKRWKL